jgi:hypothetical protein
VILKKNPISMVFKNIIIIIIIISRKWKIRFVFLRICLVVCLFVFVFFWEFFWGDLKGFVSPFFEIKITKLAISRPRHLLCCYL